MTNEFAIREVLKQMQESFGGREYSEVQVRIIGELVNRYSLKAFKTVAKKLLEDGAKKPYPIDFKTMLRALPADQKQEQEFEDYHVNCSNCMDTGFVFINDPDHEVVALCYCDAGMRLDEANEKMPRMELQTWGMVKAFPVEKFNPLSEFEGREVSANELIGTKKVNWWLKVKEDSKRYWKKTDT